MTRLFACILASLVAAPALAQPTTPAAPVALTAEEAREIIRMEDGTWDADITFPSNDPSKPDGKAKGVQVNRIRSAGMWMLNLFSVEGTPYEGTGVWGFDRTTGRLSGIWTDNNDAQIRFDDGRWDATTKTLTWTARMVQPGGGWTVTVATEKFDGDRRTFDVVALSRKGAVPLLKIDFRRRG